MGGGLHQVDVAVDVPLVRAVHPHAERLEAFFRAIPEADRTFFRLQTDLPRRDDFADVFEVRVGPVKKQGRMVMKQREGVDVCLTYRYKKFQRETWVLFTAPARVDGKTALFDLSLQPKETWRTCVTVLPMADPMGPMPSVRCVREVLDNPLTPGEGVEELRFERPAGLAEHGVDRLEGEGHPLLGA